MNLLRVLASIAATMTAILHRLGVDLRQRGLTDEQVAEACRLYPEGWSLARLALRYGGTDMTVQQMSSR